MPPAHTGSGKPPCIGSSAASLVDRIIRNCVACVLLVCGIVTPLAELYKPSDWVESGGTSRIIPTPVRVRQASIAFINACFPVAVIVYGILNVHVGGGPCTQVTDPNVYSYVGAV